MLRIGLVGAPGSGKTELARLVQTELLQHTRSCKIVDGYPAAVSDRSNLALSHYATYIGNVQVAIARYEHERKAEQDLAEPMEDDVVLTCGTCVETAVYTGLHALANHVDEHTTINYMNDVRAQAAMQMIALMNADVGQYDVVFHLPLEDREDRWTAIVEENIPEAADALSQKMIELPADRTEQVGIVVEEISKRVKEAIETAKSDRRASEPSEGEGEALRDRP
jgi:energy-coupling factor transporter ATP-binding protein EcfA2